MMIWKLMDDRPALVEQPIHHRHGPEVWEELRAELPGSAPPLYADESVQNAADVARFASCIAG